MTRKMYQCCKIIVPSPQPGHGNDVRRLVRSLSVRSIGCFDTTAICQLLKVLVRPMHVRGAGKAYTKKTSTRPHRGIVFFVYMPDL